MSDSYWWFRGCVSGVDAACGFGEDFTQGDFFSFGVFGGEVVEVCPYESPV